MLIESLQRPGSTTVVGVQDKDELAPCLADAQIHSGMFAAVRLPSIADRELRLPGSDKFARAVRAAVVYDHPLKVFEVLLAKAFIERVETMSPVIRSSENGESHYLISAKRHANMRRMGSGVPTREQHEAADSAAITNEPETRATARLPILTVIAILALTINFLYYSCFGIFFAPDSRTYITAADNLVRGHGFSDAHGYPETLITPGYPVLIALFIRSRADLNSLVILQHFMQVFLVVATTAFTLHFTGSRWQAITNGVLLSIDLPMLESANSVLTDTFFTVVFTLSLWLLWSGVSRKSPPRIACLAASGMTAGAAILIRPVASYFLLPAAVFLMLAGKGPRFRAIVVFALTFICLPLSWSMRNYEETRVFNVTSLSGAELICCRAPAILALGDAGDFSSNVGKRRTQLEADACLQLQAEYGKDCSQLSAAQKSQQYMRVAGRVIWEHPFAYLRIAVRGAGVLMLDGGPYSLQRMVSISPHVGVRLLLIYTVPCLILAVLGLWDMWKKKRTFFYFSFLTLAYVVAVSSGGESYSRYRVPVIPLYTVLITAGTAALYRILQKKRAKSIAARLERART